MWYINKKKALRFPLPAGCEGQAATGAGGAFYKQQKKSENKGNPHKKEHKWLVATVAIIINCDYFSSSRCQLFIFIHKVAWNNYKSESEIIVFRQRQHATSPPWSGWQWAMARLITTWRKGGGFWFHSHEPRHRCGCVLVFGPNDQGEPSNVEEAFWKICLKKVPVKSANAYYARLFLDV